MCGIGIKYKKLRINKGLLVLKNVIQIFRSLKFFKTSSIWVKYGLIFLDFGSFFCFFEMSHRLHVFDFFFCFVFCRAEKRIAQMNYCVIFLLWSTCIIDTFCTAMQLQRPVSVEVKGSVENSKYKVI